MQIKEFKVESFTYVIEVNIKYQISISTGSVISQFIDTAFVCTCFCLLQDEKQTFVKSKY